MNNLLVISLLVCLSSCSLLNSGGGTVKVAEEYSQVEDAKIYKKLGEVSCRSNMYFVLRSVNKSRCMDILKNGAYELKADFIYVDRITPLEGFLNTGYDMRATAFSLRESVK